MKSDVDSILDIWNNNSDLIALDNGECDFTVAGLTFSVVIKKKMGLLD